MLNDPTKNYCVCVTSSDGKRHNLCGWMHEAEARAVLRHIQRCIQSYYKLSEPPTHNWFITENGNRYHLWRNDIGNCLIQ